MIRWRRLRCRLRGRHTIKMDSRGVCIDCRRKLHLIDVHASHKS